MHRINDPQATMPISTIREALNAEVALGKLSKEKFEELKHVLGLEWREAKFKENGINNFFDELLDLFKKYDATIRIEGRCRLQLYANDFKVNCPLGESPGAIDADWVSQWPKVYKRKEMLNKCEWRTGLTLEQLAPVFDAVYKTNPYEKDYVSEQTFKSMLRCIS